MRKLLALMIAAMLLLSSCGTHSYVDINPHLSAGSASVGPEEVLTASNYAELRSAILRLVEEGMEEGAINLMGYEGYAESDLRTACSEVTKSEPLGVYGVEYMSYTPPVRVLTNYETSVSITYSKTPEQLEAVKKVSGAWDFREELYALMDSLGTELVVDTAYFVAENYDADSLIERYMNENPAFSVENPSVEVNMYPTSGLHRIIEVKLEYKSSEEELERRRSALAEAIGAMTADIDRDVLGDAETVRELVRALGEWSEFLPEREDDLTGSVARDDTFTAYGALAEGSAASEGYALALKALCSEVGLDARIVNGRWNGISHRWNLVEVEGSWYHVDAALCDYYGDDSYLLKTDEEIGDTLKWNPQGLPERATEPLSGDELPVIDPISAEGTEIAVNSTERADN